MANLPNIFQTTPAPFLGNYAAVDIATGRAYVNFYGMDHMNTTSGQLLLTTNTNYSMFGNSGTGDNGTLDIDFDLTVNQPLIVDGDATINVPIVCQAISTNHTVNPFLVNYVRRVSGATEIELISGQLTFSTPTITAGQAVAQQTAMKLAIPRTSFKQGDKLRLTCTLNAPGANSAINIGHDPANRANFPLVKNIGVANPSWTDATGSTGTSSKLTFSVPIVIDNT